MHFLPDEEQNAAADMAGSGQNDMLLYVPEKFSPLTSQSHFLPQEALLSYYWTLQASMCTCNKHGALWGK